MRPVRQPLDIDIPAPLKQALLALEAAGGTCRIVGGSVRDALLGIQPKDFDVEVYGLDLDAIANTLSKLGRTDLVGKAFAVVKLWTQGDEYDFAIPRRESKSGTGHRGFVIEADAHLSEVEALKRRDFTINALLYDHAKGEVIDYFGGLQDLDTRTLRHVSPAFKEDPLRVLRAMQFAGRFQMVLHDETAAMCHDIGHEFWTLAKERIWIEWQKWAGRSTSLSHGMRALEKSGWIRYFPQLNALLNLPQDPEWHPEGNAWTHTLCCLDALQSQTDWLSLPESERGVLAFGTLCHDLGKARCTRWAEKRGAMHWISPGHDAQSIWLAEQFFNAMRAPHEIRDKVMGLVGNHHFLNTVPECGHSDASLRRLAKRLTPASTYELVYVMVADHRGRPPLLSEAQDQRIAEFRRRIQELDLESHAPKPILLGRHLIERGMKPSPDFKSILDRAYEAQLDGAFSDSPTALKWLDENWISLSS
ncbi:polynucleotide adenylyltransferase [Pelagicoccus sp. SDUM812002]|uniref:CCA tRNA nucleotidyltransferase n=1 Tax=Pelagicoccus sp. SDUM812002 TaxID=3041266 RepID=UPI00280D0D7D|nr:polynucleotide adenylyltransferase [Pelagicoccus sp. SDUM812002]MDQ8184753.1 polynucleotide adenylyltransferase [Pelagicoccus sp. SDUM812002]